MTEEANVVQKTDRRRPRRAKGEGHLFQPSGCSIWYVQFYKDGRQFARARAPASSKRLLRSCGARWAEPSKACYRTDN